MQLVCVPETMKEIIQIFVYERTYLINFLQNTIKMLLNNKNAFFKQFINQQRQTNQKNQQLNQIKQKLDKQYQLQMEQPYN